MMNLQNTSRSWPNDKSVRSLNLEKPAEPVDASSGGAPVMGVVAETSIPVQDSAPGTRRQLSGTSCLLTPTLRMW
jgi:hypothetical protein